MIREAGPTDRALVETLLARQTDMAIFPLANLRAHGLGQGDFATDHPHATRFWLVGNPLGNGGLVALSRDGMLMSHMTESCDLAPLRPILAGHVVKGALGSADAVRPLLAALGLSGLPARKDEDEPAFALDLDTLWVPDQPGARLVPANASLRALLVDWRAAATVETQAMPAHLAEAQAATDVDSWIARDSHRVLELGGAPVALTGFNAVLPDIVQVGGVYTPPALRGRGHARLAVALHLAEARNKGVSRAVLFAASPAAARAYRGIGFEPNGSFALVLFAAPVTIEA